MMRTCPFLERIRWPIDEYLYGCQAGVNFYAVGPDRVLCRTCPVPGLIAEPVCEHLEVYTRLQMNANGHRYVKAELDCDLWAETSTTDDRCAICPLSRTENGRPLIVDSFSAPSVKGR